MIVNKYITHTHTHAQPFYGSLDFVQNNPGEAVREKTFTHSQLSWSSLINHPLSASSIYYIKTH